MNLLDIVEIGGIRYSIVGRTFGAVTLYDLANSSVETDGRTVHCGLKAVPEDPSWIIVQRHAGPVDRCRLSFFGLIASPI